MRDSPGSRSIQLGRPRPPSDDTHGPSLSCVAPQLSASIELPGAILKECLHCKKEREVERKRGRWREPDRAERGEFMERGGYNSA